MKTSFKSSTYDSIACSIPPPTTRAGSKIAVRNITGAEPLASIPRFDVARTKVINLTHQFQGMRGIGLKTDGDPTRQPCRCASEIAENGKQLE